MKIKLNGNDFEIEENSTVQDLIEKIEVKDKFFVVEKNLEVIYKENYKQSHLKENDSVEIVNFVGGG